MGSKIRFGIGVRVPYHAQKIERRSIVGLKQETRFVSSTKCVHIMVMPGWQASLAEVTLPHLKRYAEKIGADVNIISQRRFPDWPLSFEKHQIFEAGKEYDWNLYFDVDVLIHPDMDDVTLRHPPEKVGNWWYQDVRRICEAERIDVFRQDGRYYGVADCFVVTSRKTHSLWTPLTGTIEQYSPLLTTADRTWITTFSLSHNLARFKYPIEGVLLDERHIVYLAFKMNGSTEGREEVALAQLKEWGIAPILSAAPKPDTLNRAPVVVLNLPAAETVSSAMRTHRGISVHTQAASLQELPTVVAAADQGAALVVAVPPQEPLNQETEGALRQFLYGVCNRRSPVVLVSGSRFTDSGARYREVTAWNLKLMELAAEFDTGFFDLDLLLSTEGLGAMWSSPETLSTTGASHVGQQLISLLENKIFST